MSNKPNYRLRTLRGKTTADIFRRIAATTAVQEIAKAGWNGLALRPDYFTLRHHIRSHLPDLAHTVPVNLAVLNYFASFARLDMQVNNISTEASRNLFGRIRRAAEQDEKIYRDEYAKQAKG
jgi:hypothetical protein